MSVKTAFTLIGLSRVTVHASFPIQPSLHPSNICPALGSGRRVTCFPFSKSWVHATEGQSMPAGTLVTRPSPSTVTVRATGGRGIGVKVAVTECGVVSDVGVVSVMTQLSVPVQAPLQLENWCPSFALAISVTVASWSNSAMQVPVIHDRPDGWLVIDPFPTIVASRVITEGGPCGSKIAATNFGRLRVIRQGPWPLHAPRQPENS